MFIKTSLCDQSKWQKKGAQQDSDCMRQSVCTYVHMCMYELDIFRTTFSTILYSAPCPGSWSIQINQWGPLPCGFWLDSANERCEGKGCSFPWPLSSFPLQVGYNPLKVTTSVGHPLHKVFSPCSRNDFLSLPPQIQKSGRLTLAQEHATIPCSFS